VERPVIRRGRERAPHGPLLQEGNVGQGPTKPARSVLLQLLLKEKVASGELVIDGYEEGIPILIRGRGQVSEDIGRSPEDATTTTATPTTTPTQEALQPLQYLTQSQSQLQPPHAQATQTQLAMEDARLAKVAFAKATRIAQERTQEEAQEANRIKQEATADLRKAKKEDRYRATMEKLGKLPPCPKLCRGEGGVQRDPLRGGGARLTYEHIDDMVVCQDKAHLSLATKDGCLLFHLWPPRKRSPKPPAGPPAGHPAKIRQPAKNSGGGTSGARQAPKNNGNPRAGKPRQAGKGTQQQQASSQQSVIAHQRAIERLNLQLEVARVNAGARATVSYPNVVKGMPPFTAPPSRLPTSTPPTPPPTVEQPPPTGEDDKLATLLRGIMSYLGKRQL
jgi:hypothetical protein